jgi:hypothetical protein
VLSVQRLSAHARLDDSPGALVHAEAEATAGDESWQQWVEEFQRGEALILRLELTLEIADREPRVLRSTGGGFFVETDPHAPKVEQQIAELAAGDFAVLARELTALGHDLDIHELGEMYVHVELHEDVLRELAARRAREPASPRTPSGSDSA